MSIASRYFKVGRAVGVDIHPDRIAFCVRRYRGTPLEFFGGHALALPFDDASFDLVLSVESSHCYPSLPQFLDEASRVLKPGGMLLLADVRTQSALPRLTEALRLSGLRSIVDRDITDQVRKACEIDVGRFAKLLPEDGGVPGRVAARAARLYAKGALTYMSFILQRQASRP